MELSEIDYSPPIVDAIDGWFDEGTPEDDDDLGSVDLADEPLGAGYDGAGVLEHEP